MFYFCNETILLHYRNKSAAKVQQKFDIHKYFSLKMQNKHLYGLIRAKCKKDKM